MPDIIPFRPEPRLLLLLLENACRFRKIITCYTDVQLKHILFFQLSFSLIVGAAITRFTYSAANAASLKPNAADLL